MKITAIPYAIINWKMIIHLLLGTYRFGVNNKWWNDFDSMWGKPWYIKLWNIITIKPLINNYKMMKFRAIGCKFINSESVNKIW